MKRMFLEKFFPTSKIAAIRKEICGIRQHTSETLYEYWERFNKLCATCPHHQISEKLLIQYFYEGLIVIDRSMINASIGGALMDKTPAKTRNLISNMASNNQQFGARGVVVSRVENEVVVADKQRLENKITELTSLIRQLAIGQYHTSPPAKMGQLATTMNQLQSNGYEHIPSQIISNPKGNESTIILRSGRELAQQQSTPEQQPKPVSSDFEANFLRE
ncbi:hypothetical protein CR513_21688, partial [Mucuna pruriens]